MFVTNNGRQATPLNLGLESSVFYGYQEDFQGRSNIINGEEAQVRIIFLRFKGCTEGVSTDECDYQKVPVGVHKATLKVDCRYCESEEKELEIPIEFCIMGRAEACNEFRDSSNLIIK